MNQSVVAIIPARSGSKGITGKNIVLLSGYPLLAYSVVAARLTSRIDRVLLSTDSREYVKIGEHYGAEAPFLRPPELALDTSPDREFLFHAMGWFRDNEKEVPEYWVHLRPTTPLRDPRIIDDAIQMILEHPEATSLRSGHTAPETPFKWFQRNEEGYFTGIRPEDTRPEYYNFPRQSFPAVYIPDGYVDIIRASHVLSSDSLHGGQMFGFESPPCVEIDSIEELERLEFHVQRHGSPLIDYLKTNYPKG